MKIVDPILDHDSWNHLISNHPDATIFHTSSWAKVLSKTYNHRPFYLQFKNKKTNFLLPIMEVNSPILGRRGVCLPFSDLCAPLYQNNADLALIKDYVESLAAKRKWKYFELRDDAFSALCSSSSERSAEPTFFGHELDLSIGCEHLFANFSSSTRRAIRKSEKSQLEVRVECAEDAMQNFFRLHMLTRRRHGLPPQPYRFFQNIYKELISKGLGFIASAFTKETNRPIASLVFLTYREKAIYKFGASDESAWSVRPNNIVMWEGIKHLAESGFKTLHFGRTTTNQDGLRRFKSSFGSVENPIYYTCYRISSTDWRTLLSPISKETYIQKILSISPLLLNRLVGQLIYPHID